MDRDQREDRLVAIVSLLSAALVTLAVVFMATWFTASRATPLDPLETEQCHPTHIQYYSSVRS